METGNCSKSSTHFPEYSGENRVKKVQRFKSYESQNLGFGLVLYIVRKSPMCLINIHEEFMTSLGALKF